MDGASDWLQHSQHNWEVLPLFLIVIAGITGNLLVCIAICKEKKLQNTTNYFLMSLSIADLFVCCVVMPLCIVNDFMGLWPLGLIMCDMWQVMDVMMCTSSIMHMCIISMDRYMAIRNPLKNRNKSRTSVGIKIATVWLISLATASPLIILCIIHPGDILNKELQCGIFNQHFLIYGSLTAFFIPLTIMVVAYTLTIQLLRKQAINSSSKDGIRRTFSTKKSRFFSKDSVPVLKKISDHCNNVDSTPLNGYNRINKKIRNSTESDRKSAHPSETEPLAVPCQTRKTSNISITTTLTALNTPRPSVSFTQALNNNIPDHHNYVSQDTYNFSPSQDSYSPKKECGGNLSPNKELHTSMLPNKAVCSMSPNKELNNIKPNKEFYSTTKTRECESTSLNKDLVNETSAEEFLTHSGNKDLKSTNSPNNDNNISNMEYDLQYLTANYEQKDASQTTLSDISDPWELRDNSLPYPQPPPSPARRFSHSVSTTKSSQENSTLKPAVHRNSCSGADTLTCGNVHCKSKSEADITVHCRRNNLKPETTQKLSLLCLRNNDSSNNNYDNHDENHRSNHEDNSSEIQIHVPQNSLNHNSMLHKAIRKLSWGRLAKGGEANESVGSHATNNGNNGSNEPQENNVKFRQLMQKHRAAFKVAGILMAKREEKNQVKTERKAIKVLGTMFVIFVICWAPFFLTNFTMGVCQSCDIHPHLFKFFLWLGYVGSTLNPIIYTVFNKTFRKAFIKLLTCGKYTGGVSDNNSQSKESFKQKKKSGVSNNVSCRAEDLRTFNTTNTHYKNIPSDFKSIYDNLQETHL